MCGRDVAQSQHDREKLRLLLIAKRGHRDEARPLAPHRTAFLLSQPVCFISRAFLQLLKPNKK
jgi:hypothetical protein